MNVGNRIKSRRLELNLTQDELAKKIGCSNRSAVAKLEVKETIKLSTAMKLAKVLDMDVMELIGFTEPNEPTPMAREAKITHKLLDDAEMIDLLEKYFNAKTEKREAVIKCMSAILD